MFHVSDGLFFERVVPSSPNDYSRYGAVKIVKHETANPESPVIFSQELTVDEWASVVSSMTLLGESGPLFQAIRALQRG